MTPYEYTPDPLEGLCWLRRFVSRLLCLHARWRKLGQGINLYYDCWQCETCGKQRQYHINNPPVNYVG